MPSASSCLLHVFCFAETQYQTEYKKNGRRFFWNICDFWEVKSTRDDARGAHEGARRTQGGGRPPVSWTPRASCRVDSSSEKSQIFQTNSSSVFIPFGLRLIWIFCETKNMQQTGSGTGHCINMLVPKII